MPTLIIEYEVLENGKVVSECNTVITVSDYMPSTITKALEMEVETGQTTRVLSQLEMP